MPPCKKNTIMETIKVHVDWCEKNFGASVGENVPGAIVVTNKTFAGLKRAVSEAVAFHVEGMAADGDKVPAWLADGDYRFEWELTPAALLRSVEPYVTIAAIARATGINEQLLSHYANGLKKPREAQRERIVEGLHKIGEEILSVV